MPTLNLRYLYSLSRTETKRIFNSKHSKVSKREEQTRQSIMRTAILKHGSTGLLNQVLLGKRRSDSTDERLIEDFQEFEQPEHPVPRDKHYLRALRVCETIFRPKTTLHPVSFPDLRYYPWTKNVSAEAPYTYLSKYQEDLRRMQSELQITDPAPTFHNLEDTIFEDNRLLIHQIKDGDPKFWDEKGRPKPYFHTTLHARAHVVGHEDADKIRAVFGVPKLLLMAENMFIWPLQTYYLNNKTESHPLLWGNEIMKGGWLKLTGQLENGKRRNTILSLDWSQFDKRALHEVIDDVHKIWRSWFDFSSYEPTVFYPLASAPDHDIRLGRLWTWMTDMVKHYPILQPDGRVLQWTRNGIASGFQQTQLLDSFVNTIMLLTCLSSTGVNIESDHFWIKVQGDDSLIGFPERKTFPYETDYLDKLATKAAYYFNAKLSTKKSFISNRVHGQYVLGYFNSFGIPYRYDDDLLSHLVFPERPQRLEETAASCVGIAMAAMGCSRVVYSICLDAYEFITNELKRQPTVTQLNWMIRANIHTEINVAKMPSFYETKMACYAIPERTLLAKERLWPTLPESKHGFHFLRHLC
nr:RNA-dependent RNA polymerase [Sarcosphaera coronaria partitivirus]